MRETLSLPRSLSPNWYLSLSLSLPNPSLFPHAPLPPLPTHEKGRRRYTLLPSLSLSLSLSRFEREMSSPLLLLSLYCILSSFSPAHACGCIRETRRRFLFSPIYLSAHSLTSSSLACPACIRGRRKFSSISRVTALLSFLLFSLYRSLYLLALSHPLHLSSSSSLMFLSFTLYAH